MAILPGYRINRHEVIERDTGQTLTTYARRNRTLAGLLALIVLAGLTLAACNNENEIPGGGSGIIEPSATPTTQSTAPAPTSTVTVGPTPSATSTPTSNALSNTATPTASVTSTPTSTSPTPSPSPTTPTPTNSPTATPPPSATPTAINGLDPLGLLEVERVFNWYSPLRPTHLEQATDGTGRIYVSEQNGKLIELTGDPSSPTGNMRTVLDIQNIVSTNGNEEGLLGFALHPEFDTNRKIFVYFSASVPRRSVIAELTFNPDGTVDPGSRRNVMEVSQPQGNHNGGMLAFGPDGYLYIGLGDGGGAGDRSDNGQNLSNVLGTILRIDIDAPGAGYGVPADNPFAGQNGVAPEIWAYGLRNPWRFSFDRDTGELWAGDVGQNRIEEIDIVTRGGNYGWRLKEGPDCFNPTSNCEQQASTSLIEPVTSYGRSLGCSVTGGYVYKGTKIPSLIDAYMYADFCTGIVWALRHSDGQVTEQMIVVDTNHSVSAFGQTLDGEVYILTHSPGIFRFVEK